MEHLRFALLINDTVLDRWHVRCLDSLQKTAELTGVFLTAEASGPAAGKPGSPLMRAFATRVERKTTIDIATRLAGVPRLHVSARHEPIRPGHFDFILKLGRGAIPEEIERATRIGVWCFQHEIEGGCLPFFREVYDGEDVTRAALLAFEGHGVEPDVLEEGYFPTDKRSYASNRDRIVDSIAQWPARACRRLLAGANSGSAARAIEILPSPRHHKRPPSLLRFFTRIVRRRLDFAWERLFRHRQWNIGILPVRVGALLRGGADLDSTIEWFPLDLRDGFLADPFGIVRNGTIHVLCEYFGYRSKKGDICALQISARGFSRTPEHAISLPGHMSYPFLVEDAGEIFCVPETCFADEIALFRAIEFPRKWSKVAVLVDQFAGIDPTIFRHGDRWWLMCTKKGHMADVELWVWHAAELRGPWIAHARNPVKTDVRSARPGGAPFVHDGALYRPAQDCSKTYGWRLALQRVKSLTPLEFSEDQVGVLEASPASPFPAGRHTLTPVGDAVLIDGHRVVFVWPAFQAFLKIWATDV